jgi:hypothetical protein
LNIVPVDSRFSKLRVGGSGDPLAGQNSTDDPVENSEVTGTATMSWLLVRASVDTPVNETNALRNILEFCATFARTFEIRSTAVPVGDKVNERPTHPMEVADVSTAGTLAGCGVPELSTVRLTSRDPFGWIRLVSFTGRKRLRLPVMVAPGDPPEHVSTMIPSGSAIPSECTTGVPPAGTHMIAAACEATAKLNKINEIWSKRDIFHLGQNKPR